MVVEPLRIAAPAGPAQNVIMKVGVSLAGDISILQIVHAIQTGPEHDQLDVNLTPISWPLTLTVQPARADAGRPRCPRAGRGAASAQEWKQCRFLFQPDALETVERQPLVETVSRLQ